MGVVNAEPLPPINVRLVYDDGQQQAVSCIYDGRDDDGQHRWVVIDGRDDDEPVAILIGALPPGTTVIVPTTRP